MHQKELLEKHIRAAADQKNGLKVFEKHVKVAKVSKAFERRLLKLEFSVVSSSPTEEVFDIRHSVLVAQGCRPLPGQAPPGYFEDQIQNWLESLQEQK